MNAARSMDPRAYERLVAGGGLARTELRAGVPVEKPERNQDQQRLLRDMAIAIGRQLDRSDTRLQLNRARLAVARDSYYIPDIVILPHRVDEVDQDGPTIRRDPALLVIDLLSPDGDDDQQDRIAGYRLRGDAEVWLLQPSAALVTRWTRRDDGEYDESTSLPGITAPVLLPEVRIDLGTLLAG